MIIIKKFIAILLMLVLVFTCFAACSDNGEDTTGGNTVTEKSEEEIDLKDIFKGFEAKDLEGEKVTDEIFKGKKVTMINVWGTFCGPCVREMPDLNTLNEKYADKSFQVVGIVCDAQYITGEVIEEKLQEAKGILESTGVEYLNIFPYEALNKTILAGTYSIPLTYFVNEKGEIIGESYLGSKSLEDWENIILKLLGE